MKSTGRSYLLIINHLVNQNIAPQLRKDPISSQEPYMEREMEMLYQEEGKKLYLKVTKNESFRIPFVV